LRIILADGYVPPSPLRDVAANRSVDQLAPNDPVAAEMAQMRETLEDIRKTVSPRIANSPSLREDLSVLRGVITESVAYITPWDLDALESENTSEEQKKWTRGLRKVWDAKQEAAKAGKAEDPWASDSGYSDEPPF
jgi:hypothetical protein